VPYRLRLFSGSDMLRETELETIEEVGQRIAEYVDEGISRWEIVYVDESGKERPLTVDEDQAVIPALGERKSEIDRAKIAPCPHCGRKEADHEPPLYPVRLGPGLEGPIYFACWTDAEREDAASWLP
jgi:hypothetical protein